MGAVAVDLTPVVDILIQRPLDRAALDHVRGVIGDQPQAYATALRCAAKRTTDGEAAAFWLTEAARVHESVEDLGGAIALLFRAWEHDPGCARTRELLAGNMARLAARVGLAFVPAAAPQDDPPRRVTTESGLRPSPLEAPSLMPSVTAIPNRDTLPGLFGRQELDRLDAGAEPASRPAPETEVHALVHAVEHRAEMPAMEPASEGALPMPLRRQRRTELPPPPEARGGRDAADDRDEPDDGVPISQIARVGALSGAAVAPAEPPPATRRSSSAAERPSSREAASARPAVPPRGASEDEGAAPEGAITQRRGASDDGPVGVLFEALHELHFARDAKEGARFVCQILQETLQPAAVLVHLYDINRGEYVVAAASGKRADVLLDCSTADDEPLVLGALKSGEATLVVDPSSDPRLSRGRWLLVEPKRSVLCAPASLDGRYLGLVEVADPACGVFDEGDRNALTYVAATFASFLSRCGVVLSEPPPRGVLASDVAAATE